MQSSGHVESQGLLSLFFKSVPEDVDLSWSVLDAQDLEEAKVDLDSPW